MDSVESRHLTDAEDGNSDVLPPGTTLLGGQYTIDRYLSSGGFGITYHARDSLDRPVVIKECYPEALCRRKAKTVRARSSVNVNEFQSLVSMFVREARSIAKLNNPNIVGVHQVFEDNETAYMALDLIEGRDLLGVMEDDPDSLSPEIIVGLLRKLLTAVATVHSVDMLHRDISPDNILLDKWGNPVLIDFGAAREQASKKSRAISAMLVVKDGYSPQEFYISGSKQGPWSDLYSLAATFHHLICGEAPPNSQNRLAALASKRPDPYMPLAGRIEGYDNAFLRAIDQAMNVFPQDRLQSAEDWLGMIDTGRTPRLGNRKGQTTEDLQKVVATLIDEVGDVAQTEAEDDPAEAPAPQSKPKAGPKAWPPLPDAAPAAPKAVSPSREQPLLWFEKIKERELRHQRKAKTRKALRRSSVVVMVCTFAVVMFDHPQADLARLGSVEIEDLIDKGRDWTARTANILTTQL